MKEVFKIICILITMLPLMGCEALEELLEEEFEETITFDGLLEIVEKTPVSDIEDDITVTTQIGGYRITSDPDIAALIEDNNAEITKIKIDEIRYSFVDFIGNEEAVVESITFFVTSQDGIIKRSTFDANIFPSDADEQNITYTYVDDFSEVESAVARDPNRVLGFQFIGTLSKNPVDFKVGIRVAVTVTIKANI